MIKAPWRVFSALALLTAIACGDDDNGTEPEGSISVSASPTTLTVQQGASGTVNVTLTRGGGFAAPVTVTVEGLPAGVTASVNPTSLTGTTTSAVVTVNVASTVPAGNYPVTVRGSATGIGAATAQYTLTVTAAPTANYTLSATAASAAQGGSGTSTISIARTNFTGAVALTLENPPAGITGTFNPASATGDNSVLTINVAGTVAPGTQNLTVKGTAAGQADKTTTVALTVTAAQAANYTLTAAPATLTINAGGNSQTTVTIARTNFTGTVNLALDAPPAGITATFDPAAATGNTSTATINVAGTVAPGNHTLTIKGTATGIADKTTTVALTVGAAAGFTIAANPTTLTIAPGANSTSTVTIVRTNFTTDVALSLLNPPAGITGTFTPALLTGTTTLTSSLQVNVAGTVQPGSYPITVRGVGGAITQTATITVTVPAAGSNVTFAMQPTTLTIQQGSSGQATLNVTRTNFSDNIVPSVTGNPAGMTVTFNPNPISGNSATVTVNVGAGVAAGSSTLTISGGVAPGNPSTTLAVTVTPQSSGGAIVYEFCTNDAPPLKFWRQSGGTWAEVAPTTGTGVTRFSFDISGATGGIAWVRSVASASVRNSMRTTKSLTTIQQFGRGREKLTQVRARLTNQRGAVTNQTGALTNPHFETFVMFALTTEITTLRETCTTPTLPTPVNKAFTVTGMAASEQGFLTYGTDGESLSSATANYTLSTAPGTYDWLAAFGPAPVLPSFASVWTHYRLGRGEPTSNTTPVAINRTGATAFTTVPFTVTGGAGGSFNAIFQTLISPSGAIFALPVGDPFSMATSGNLVFLAPGDRLATDMNGVTMTNVEVGADFIGARAQIQWFGQNPPASANFTLPATVPTFTVTAVNGAPVPTWTVAGQIPAGFQTNDSEIEVSYTGAGESTLYTIIATRGWLTANNMSTSYSLTGPTLPGYLATWAPAAPLFDAQVALFSNFRTAPTAGVVSAFSFRLVESP